MQTTTNGQGPREVTPENDEGTVTGQGNSPQKTTNNSADFTATFIAFYSRVKAATSIFCADRGIGADTLLMIVLALIYGYARVTA